MQKAFLNYYVSKENHDSITKKKNLKATMVTEVSNHFAELPLKSKRLAIMIFV